MKVLLSRKRKLFLLMSLIIVVASSFTVFAAKPDRKAPTAPSNLKASSVTDTSLQLSWGSSTDNVRVDSYDVYQNSKLIGNSKTTTYAVNALTPQTTYKFYVIAKDTSGNKSASSNIVSVTTVSAATDSTGTTGGTGSTTTDTGSTTGTTTTTGTDSTTGTTTGTDSTTGTTTDTGSTTGTTTGTGSTTGTTTTNTGTTTGSTTDTSTSTGTTTQPAGPTPSVVAMDTRSNRIVGYYAAWAAYSGITPDKINTSKVDYINYAFANIGSDYKITLGYPDVDPGNFAKLNALKAANPNLRTLISVGGWNWSGRFSDAALTDSSRSVFADSCVDFIVKYGFDGVDIDWEYPVSGGAAGNIKRAEDKQNFTLLMQKIREKLNARGEIDGKHYLLTFAGAATTNYTGNVELTKLSQYVDFANLMTYDIHGSWDPYTDLNAPLYNNTDASPQYKWSVDQSVNCWLNAGFPAKQLVMGVPFYGYVYNAVSNSNNGLYQPFSGSSSISYANIVGNYLNNPQFTRFYHSQSMVPWLFNGSTFISYDDEQSIATKAQYARAKGLGGAMVWELSQDSNGVLLNSLYSNMK